MNKPITEEDFTQTVQKHTLSLVRTLKLHPLDISKDTFELAKRMAIEFADFILRSGYHTYFAIRMEGDIVVGSIMQYEDDNGRSITPEQLFELYQQQK
jgi:hypothetical protein